MVIDVAKGVEETHCKLVQFAELSNIPMIVFINKLEREGRCLRFDGHEVEAKTRTYGYAIEFPDRGMGYDFQGIYNLWEKNIDLFSGDSRKNIEETIAFSDVQSPEIRENRRTKTG